MCHPLERDKAFLVSGYAAYSMQSWALTPQICLPTQHLHTQFQSWAIDTWDRYSGIPVLPEVKISTAYQNTDLFKKIPIT